MTHLPAPDIGPVLFSAAQAQMTNTTLSVLPVAAVGVRARRGLTRVEGGGDEEATGSEQTHRVFTPQVW